MTNPILKQTLTAERLRELFHYDPLTGVFTRLMKRGPFVAGRVAGGDCGHPHPSGFMYWKIAIDYHQYRRGRLAWLYVYGRWPDGEIDHIDGVENNDAIANLRDVTRLQNSQNTRIRKHNIARFKGVKKFHRPELKKPWAARITVNRVEKCLGYFPTAVEAAHAYDRAALEHHGPFACTNKMLGLVA